MADAATPEPGEQPKLSEKEVAEFKEVFDLMDKDRGGTLNLEEIKQLMDMLGMKVRQDELEQILREVDTDGSGQVDFDEFLQVMSKPQQLPYTKHDVLRAFQIFAQPGDPPGHIKPDVLEQALVKYANDKYTQDEVVRLVNSLELTPDGYINFQQKVDFAVQ